MDATSNLSAFVDASSLSIYSTAVGLHGDGNVLVSPLSILYATLMVYLGARGNTKVNLDESLKFNAYFQGEDLLNSFSSAIPEIKGIGSARKGSKSGTAVTDPSIQGDREEKVLLALANGIFVQDGFEVNRDYLGQVVQSLRASLEKKNFINATEPARRDINKWVEERTGGKIKNLIPQGGVDQETRLVLANALYFKAPWMFKFVEGQTKKGDFHLLSGKKHQVDLMHIQKPLNYVDVKELNAQYLEIPYYVGQASFIVILPRNPAGLRELEIKLTPEKLGELAMTATDSAPINVTLPKFKVESSFDVVKLLQKLGVDDVFSTAADLSGIATPAAGLFVSSAFHKTFIDLNENGTEAAAATAMAVASRSSFQILPKLPPVQFLADHPFMYAIRHNPSKLILFIGRIESL